MIKRTTIPDLKNEKWFDIVGTEGYYAISDKLRIKRLKSFRGQKLYPERLFKPRLSSYGYYEIVFIVNGVRQKLLWHRIVATAFIPNPENKPEVNHKNGIRTDFRIENLEWVTRSENQLHKTRVLKKCSGESHVRAKLTNEDVLDIHNKYNSGKYSHIMISEIYKVDAANITKILKGKLWVDFAPQNYIYKRIRRTNLELLKTTKNP